VASVLGLLVTATAVRADSDPEKPSGIEMRWLVDAGARPVALADPVVKLRLTNLDPVAWAVSVGPLEDAGSLQTRRIGQPASAILPAHGSIELPIRFGKEIPGEFTHSGLIVALLTACPEGKGACTNGASEPLFFHPDGRSGGLLVYDERVLCESFGCGDLRSRVKPERGTWRVLGGGPLLGATVQEEPETDAKDDVVVEGGD